MCYTYFRTIIFDENVSLKRLSNALEIIKTDGHYIVMNSTTLKGIILNNSSFKIFYLYEHKSRVKYLEKWYKLYFYSAHFKFPKSKVNQILKTTLEL